METDANQETTENETLVNGLPVFGVGIDAHTRCTHWHTKEDIVSIRMACCGQYYACIECHKALAGHAAERWPAEEFDAVAVLCGQCGTELSIREYFQASNRCPHCEAAFNPGCKKHWPLYFEVS